MNPIGFTLLIDDDKVTNFYNSKVVSRHSRFNKVVSVISGKAGLEYLEKAKNGEVEKPNLIFLDLNMPAMNGWEFLEAYKKLDSNFTKDIKVIILTTSSNPNDLEQSKANDAVRDFINKPLSIDILNEVIDNHYEFITIRKNNLIQ